MFFTQAEFTTISPLLWWLPCRHHWRRVALPSVHAPGAVHTLEEGERQYIAAALRSNGGNRTKTAKQLEIGIATLHRKIKEYNLNA